MTRSTRWSTFTRRSTGSHAATGRRCRPLAAPAAAVEAFLARFGPDAQVVTGQPGLADLLDADGLETVSGGYSFTVLLTSATFELSLAIVDWQQVGLLVATDED